jgi:hypothetical protein
MERGVGSSERSGRDEPAEIVIHICMETTQGNSLHYLYVKLAKPLCFSYYLSCFLFSKIGEREGRTGSAQKWDGGGTVVVVCK